MGEWWGGNDTDRERMIMKRSSRDGKELIEIGVIVDKLESHDLTSSDSDVFFNQSLVMMRIAIR